MRRRVIIHPALGTADTPDIHQVGDELMVLAASGGDKEESARR
jgi:hypothetical protein